MAENNILITGGSGFLGRGIMHRAQQSLVWRDAHFIVYSRDETKQDVCKARYPDAKYVLGDVKDQDRLYQAMKDNGVTTVIHAGAIKYIPEAEFNVEETIDVNVTGSRNVAHAAYMAGVQNVVGVSTDKACRPLNVYGFSKAMMERIWGEYARNTSRRYVLVRYGNVIGSTGSVIPKFREALHRGDGIKLTDGSMTRYWLGIDEAVWLIEMALDPFCDNHGTLSGSCIIPRPQSSYMSWLVNQLCAEAGVDPTDAVEVIGQRPGEKMHEELMHEQESVRAISWPTHYELTRVGSRAHQHSSLVLSSEHPEGGWLTTEQLRDAVSQAEAV